MKKSSDKMWGPKGYKKMKVFFGDSFNWSKITIELIAKVRRIFAINKEAC